jgi:hypothetical protein
VRICILEGTVSAFDLLAVGVSESNGESLGLTRLPHLRQFLTLSANVELERIQA